MSAFPLPHIQAFLICKYISSLFIGGTILCLSDIIYSIIYHLYLISSCLLYRYISKFKIRISRKRSIFFCHSFQKVKPIYYTDALHIEWNISSLYFLKFWWLWLTDNENPKFSISENLNRSIKKGYFKQKCQASKKHVHFYALNTWLGLLLHELLHQCGVAWRQSVCGTAQV